MPLRASAASPLSTPALYAGPTPSSLRRMLGSSSSPSQTGPTSSRREPAHGAGGWWDHLRKADNLHLLPATSPDPGSHRQHWSTAPLRSFGRTPTPEHTGADAGSFSGVFRQNGSCKLHATSACGNRRCQQTGKRALICINLCNQKLKMVASAFEPGC